ncbi:MAG: hypothetical protein M3179_04075 [Actinomycetota bacterium]|nr:hypothetical protein [Actinomycetota bacterium]
MIALIGALQKREDDRAEALISQLIADHDLRRVVGALGVAGSAMAETLAKVTGRSVDDLLAELEDKMTSAPAPAEPA